MVSLLLDQVIKLHLQVKGQMLLQVKIHQVRQIAVTYGGILTMVNYISTIMMEAQHNGYVGQIVAWSGSAGSLPDGYFLCDGSAISRTTYAALFAVVGTTHGSGNGSTTFNIPDLRDRFVVGASNSTGDTTYPGVSPGATGGNANAVVVTHDHDADATSNVSDPGHRHSSRGLMQQLVSM